MASKSSSPGPSATPTPAAKQARSRKAATQHTDTGRAGSAGGIVLERENDKKSKSTPTAPKTSNPQSKTNEDSNKTPRRKPRKLNKDPTSSTPASASKEAAAPTSPPTATEIEALKSRVRGLEAKVEELYKSGSLDRPGRSPRRRGKGRKGSSQQQVPTLAKGKVVETDDDVEEIGRGDDVEENDDDDELVRLEGELEVARQDLAAFRPRQNRRVTEDTDDDVEEVQREDTARNDRHVTLSGSYRIPLPASVSVDDVKHIQSGVSAAQNVARSFLEQRRAVKAASASTSTSTSTPSPSLSTQAQGKSTSARPTPKSVSSNMQIEQVSAPGKQSWSEWIGGYSVAISRAVKSIEHEAAVESQRVSTGTGSASGGGSGTGGGTKKKNASRASGVAGTGKRPGVKTKMSGEQVEGLMS